jgi:hypothetical protein
VKENRGYEHRDFKSSEVRIGIRSGASEVFGLKVNRCTLTGQGVKGPGGIDPRAFGPQILRSRDLWLKGPEVQRLVGRELLPCTPIHRGVTSDSRVPRGQMERLIDRFVEVSVSEVSAKQVCTTVD